MTDTLVSYTDVGTYAEFVEKKWILRTGMLVDVVVLSENLKTNSDRIKKSKGYGHNLWWWDYFFTGIKIDTKINF